MCGVCVSVQGGSIAPSLYVAGFAAVGAAGWQRFRAMLPTRAQLEGRAHADDASHDDHTTPAASDPDVNRGDLAALGSDSDMGRGDLAEELVLAGITSDVDQAALVHRSPRRARRSD